MLALARVQRKLRLLNSPYKTPQSYVGGPRLDSALMASSGRTATTKAMGKGSTQFQHLVQTEVPLKVLEGWLGLWAEHYGMSETLRGSLRPHTAGSELLELGVLDELFATRKNEPPDQLVHHVVQEVVRIEFGRTAVLDEGHDVIVEDGHHVQAVDHVGQHRFTWLLRKTRT